MNLNEVYELGEDKKGKFLICFKSTKKGGYSEYKPNFFKYEVGKTYESRSDGSNEENSFGLSGWTKEKAIEYSRGNNSIDC